MNGEHIASGVHQIEICRDVEVDKDNGTPVRVIVSGQRVPPGAGRGLSGGHRRAVEIGGEAVVVLHAKGEGGQGGRIIDSEGNTDVDTAVDVIHLGLHIGVAPDEIAVIVTNTGIGSGPRGIVELLVPPGVTDIGGRDQESADGILGDDSDIGSAPGLGQPVGKVVELLWIVGILLHDGPAIGFHECEIATGILAEFEVGMELASISILVGSEDDE